MKRSKFLVFLALQIQMACGGDAEPPKPVMPDFLFQMCDTDADCGPAKCLTVGDAADGESFCSVACESDADCQLTDNDPGNRLYDSSGACGTAPGR
jgi:hypothetical protein